MRDEKLYKGAENMSTVTEQLLTRKQIAALFQVSELTVIRLEKAGKLPAFRFGAGSVRYKRSDVLAYIESCLTPKAESVTA
jgi:excisionase family DNA binding protein